MPDYGIGESRLSRRCIQDNVEGETISQMFQVVVDRPIPGRLCIVLDGEATNSQQEFIAPEVKPLHDENTSVVS